MAEKFKAPRGTFDALPDQQPVRQRIEDTARRLLEGAGYGRIETPAFEQTDLFARGVGESTEVVQKQMFSFTDQGGRELTLRPEGTAPICRAYIEHGMHKLPQPVKLWYSGPFFRHERPQAGRFRQFHQVGAEAIGSDSPLLDAELIVLVWDLITELGVEEVSLRLGSLGSEGDDAAHLEQVRGLLDHAGAPYEVDESLVRGLDYYTRTVFELHCDRLGAQSQIGGGGRYDGLVEQLGGPPTPAAGWAIGLDRVALALGESGEPERRGVFIVADEDSREPALALAIELRRAGITADLDLAGRSQKGQMKQADRSGARHALLIEGDAATLRDLESGEQREVKLERIAEELS